MSVCDRPMLNIQHITVKYTVIQNMSEINETELGPRSAVFDCI